VSYTSEKEPWEITQDQYTEKRRPKKLMRIADIDTRFQPLPEGSSSQVTELMNIIDSGGEIPPILVSKGGYLQDGRHRLEAYKRLGFKDIEVAIGIDPHSVEGKEEVNEFNKQHEQIIEKALAEGKQIPPEVLKDYPKLQSRGTVPEGETGSNLLPMPPTKGPPLPRFLNLKWPGK
jgi:hypothetical protein